MLRLLHGCLVLSSFRVILCKKTGTFSNWSTTACVVTCIAAKQTAASLWSLSIWTSVRPYPSHPNMCLSYRSSLVHRMSISWLEHNSVWLALHRTKLLPPCEAFLYEHPFVPTCPIQRCACRTGVAWCTEWTYLDWSTTACVVTCIAWNQTAASLWSLSIWTSVRPYLSHPNMCLLYGSSLVHRMNISWLEHNSVWLALHGTKLLPPCEAFLYEHPFVPTCPIQTCACCTGVAWCTEWTYLDWSTTAFVVTCIASNQTAASLWSLSIWTSVRPYLSHPKMCLFYGSSLVHRMNISWLEHNSVCRDLHCMEPNCCLLVKPFYMNIRSSLLVPSKHVPVVRE